MEHGRVIDREWMAVCEATEQRIKASNYEITLSLIAREFIAHLKPYKTAWSSEQVRDDDRIALGSTREMAEEVLSILRYREPDLYASIKAAALTLNYEDPDTYEADREAEEDRLNHELDEKG